MRALLIAITILMCGCGYAPHKDPDTFTESSQVAAREAARLHAGTIGGSYHQSLCCGSMEPLIHTGDWVVTKRTPFTDDMLGRVIDYQPKWHPEGPVEHRMVSGNAKDGYIASGDNNRYSEPLERVTASNYIAEVVAIYKAQ